MKQRRRRSSNSSSAMKGVFTRGRSEIFLHRTRSGSSRPDSAYRLRRSASILLSRKSRKAASAGEKRLGGGGASACSAVKDLRTRRVFSSPSFGANGDEEEMSHLAEDKGGLSESLDLSGAQSASLVISHLAGKIEAEENIDDVDVSKGSASQPSASVLPQAIEKLEVAGEKKDILDKRDDGGGWALISQASAAQSTFLSDKMEVTVQDGVVYNILQDSSVQSTHQVSPHATTMVEERKCGLQMSDGGDQLISQDADIQSRPSEQIASVNDKYTQKEPTLCNRPQNRLNNLSSSRLKVFWNSSSHGYKRLLPFLKDLTNNNSSILQILPCQSIRNTGKIIRESTSAALLTSIPQGSSDMSHEGLYGGGLKESNTKLVKENETLALISETKNPSNQHPTTNIPKSFVLKEDFSSIIPKCENDLICKPEGGPIIHHESLSVNELVGSSNLQLSARRADVYLRASSPTIDEKDVEPHPRPHQSRVLAPLRCNNLAPVKGILKRQRRGCRGFCSCLECASFILHAERAFEFSKRQLLEAEDVAVGLIKELLDIKELVEKSVVPKSRAEDHAVLKLSQVQEICRRASEAEELARIRLSEMTCDLNIHCRATYSPPPRVTFAEPVEERPSPVFMDQ